MQFTPRQQRVPIGGVPVLFPFKPYPSQRAMMAKVIQSLNQGANALLESPTGSGKSLALLCSSLAWVTQQRDGKTACAPCGCDCHSSNAAGPVPTPCQNGIKTEPVPTPCQNGIKTEPVPTPCLNGIKTEPVPTPCRNGMKTEPVPTPCRNRIKTEPDPTPCRNGTKTEPVPTPCQNGTKTGNNGTDSCTNGSHLSTPATTHTSVRRAKGLAGCSGEDELDEDFCKPKKRYRTPGGVANSGSKRSCVKSEGEEEDRAGPSSWKMEVEADSLPVSQRPSVMDTGLPTSHPPPSPPPPCDLCPCAKSATQRAGCHSIPKVYFGTRTHQQVAQITHELAKTAYTGTPMCILGSREHACIHPVVSKSKRKNDECKKTLEDSECSFYYRVAKKLGSQAQLLQHGLTSAWDMEDLVKLGRRVKACPYFALRGIKEEAHIVFCPYNYLIDPLIRDQMLIELSGQVVVFDEAHNMEDAAREAASLSLTSLQLEDLCREFTDILDNYLGKLRSSFESLTGICVSVKKWIDVTISSLPHNGFDQTCGIWPGQDFIPLLRNMGIIDQTPALIKSQLKAITDAINEQKRKAEEGEESEYIPSPSTAAISLLKGLAMVLSYLFRQGQKFADDYRVSLMRTATTKPTDDGWRRRRRSRVMEKVWMYTLNFWCLNPSVAFSELSCAHSVILTSGTLSPLSSFSSELGMEFKIQLEATHVVPETQTFIRSISCGPHGRALLANYQNSETYEFQDEVGAAVRQVCQVVPNGVLCFFSSYKMLHKLTQRWQMTGLWNSIEERKAIVTEPTGSNKTEFEAAMRQFYGNVHGNGHVTGALFLAVCRGKVSEGLDFSDHNARAVITVGIPFPSIKDKQVELKKEYNNQYCGARGLLTGSQWYDIQAFRAINQALGRCIRHKEDWGALVLLDDRFGKGVRYTRGLSKWIRQRLSHERNFSAAVRSLANFSQRMLTLSSRNDSLKENWSLSTTATDTSSLSTSKLPSPHPLSPSLHPHSPSLHPHSPSLHPTSPSLHPHSPSPHPHSPSLHPVTSNTPLPGNERVKWKSSLSPSSSSSALGSLISQLRTFRYPGGPQSSAPSQPPAGGQNEGVIDLDDSVEITCVESVSDLPVSVVTSPNHTSPAPPSFTNRTPPAPPSSANHTPLLFTDSSATPTPAPPATIEVEDDNDETPPLMPHPCLQECNKVGVASKAATPLRRTKVNTRMALSRSCKASLIGGCSQSTSSTTAEQVGGAIICSSCGVPLTPSEVMGERVGLEERLVMLGREGVRGSRLWREVGCGDVFLLPATTLLSSSYSLREDGVCNAVWDECLGMCFGILECSSGHRVGVKVHTAPDPLSSLVDKVVLPAERTDIQRND